MPESSACSRFSSPVRIRYRSGFFARAARAPSTGAWGENRLQAELSGKSYDPARLEIVHAPEVIGCDEKPTDVIRLKRNSSMMKAIILLRDREDIAAMVSTGSTGALVTGALVRLGRIPGVIRPAFCPLLQTMDGGIVGICDSGANVEVTPAHLRQFAIKIGRAHV